MSTVTAVKAPLRERINLRLIIFIAVAASPIIWVMYTFVRAELTQGITDVGGGYKEVDLKAMSTFEFDQQAGRPEDIPQKWRALDGQKVIFYGEIAPATFAARSLSEFELVYSVSKCCMTARPLVQHFIHSRMTGGKEAIFYPNLVKVKGTLHVNVKRSEGQVTSIYQIDVESLEPA